MMQSSAFVGNVNSFSDFDIGHLVEEGVEEAVRMEVKYGDEVFSSYKFREVIPGCLPHPGDIVESSSLAAIEGPPCTYPLNESIPDEVVKSGKLSGLQLEGIIYACQRHQIILSNKARAGFFIGDAAGVGKGRQIAGIILDNFARGRTRHVWFSISTDLIVDAKRDLADIGCHIKVIAGCQQLDKETKVFGLSPDFKQGILFCTYATLVSASSKKDEDIGGIPSMQSSYSAGMKRCGICMEERRVHCVGFMNTTKQYRLDQLVNWCGGQDFDGCLVFDECHKAKHFVPGNEQASTKVATAVMNIQRMMPKARVVYCSATGVSDVKNMAFMERLGLWGEGMQFSTFEIFLDTVHKRGLGVAEMLAMEMKSSGVYLSRSLSFKQAEFLTTEVDLLPEQVKMYNTATHVWNEVRKTLITALQRTGSAGNKVWSVYWSAHQRFHRQLCLGIKVRAIVEEAKNSLANGQCVVIGLQSTGEASLQSEVNESQPTSKFMSVCREILRRFIEQHLPTSTNKLTEGQKQLVSVEEDVWCCTAKKMLLEFTEKIDLPNSFLDEIIDKLGGPSNVAEMTGRKARIVRPSPNDPPVYQQRYSDDASCLDSLNVQERNSFMSGQKLVAIISDAASTGISLHADSNAANQRRRVHLTVELPWSADKAVQQLGRSHRSNQTSGPLYKLMTTNLGGERRFAAAVARRLQSLGALTKGDRRAASGADLAEFDIDTPYGRSALRIMYNSICLKTLAPGVCFSDVSSSMDLEKFNSVMMSCLILMDVVETETLSTADKVKDKILTDVGKFLNRILGLKVEHQNLIFNYFTCCLKAQVNGAKKEGRYNEGLVDLVASSIQLVSDREVLKSNRSSIPTRHVTLLVDRGMSWEKAMQRLTFNPGDENGFYCSKNEIRKQRLYVLAVRKDGLSHAFKIARPNTGLSSFDEDRADFLNKYYPVSPSEAESGWKEAYENSMSSCIHGPKCKTGNGCTVGMRFYRIHLLCGGTMNLMSLLELVLMRYAANLRLTKTETSMRVMRAQLDNGRRVVGVRYPHILIPFAEKTLLEEATIGTFLRQNQVSSSASLLSTQSQSSSSSAQSPSSITLEPVSSIDNKLLQKATNPPVTIRNFFKTKSKENETAASAANSQTKSSSGSVDESSNHENCRNGDLENEDCEVVDSKNGDSKDGESKDGESKNKESKDKESKDNEMHGQNTAVVFTNCNDTVKFSKNKLSDKAPSKAEKAPSKAPGKRSASSLNLPGAKKAKQGNIMTSFMRQKDSESNGKKKTVSCPICNISFDNSISNIEFNKHVDNCLIE